MKQQKIRDKRKDEEEIVERELTDEEKYEKIKSDVLHYKNQKESPISGDRETVLNSIRRIYGETAKKYFKELLNKEERRLLTLLKNNSDGFINNLFELLYDEKNSEINSEIKDNALFKEIFGEQLNKKMSFREFQEQLKKTLKEKVNQIT